MKERKISVIIPCRNEERFIGACLDSLLAQDYPFESMEIFIVDGMSDDRTREIVHEYAGRHRNICLLDNPAHIVPSAMNIGVRAARGEFILRADAHCIYPSHYIATLINYLINNEADNVGGVCDTAPGADTDEAKVIASCLGSRFGVGFSFRTFRGEAPLEVETVPFGAWRSNHFKKYGKFDEKFARSQDLEYNIRVKKMGGKILCLPWLRITYYTRDTFAKLKNMFFQYGYWKVLVRQKHHVWFSMRKYFPPLLVLGTALSLAAGFLISPWAFVIPASYLILNTMVSFKNAWSDNLLSHIYLYVYAFAIIHYFYGLGYFRGFWDVYITKKIGFTDITR